MTDLTKLSIAELKKSLHEKKFSCVELVSCYIEKIKKLNPELNAYILVNEEGAIEDAKKADENIASGKTRSLEGIPFAIKDNYCTKDVKTECASHILDNFIPPYESTVTENLWNEGAILLGKVNMDEFAMGSGNLTSYYGPSVNPLKREGEDTKLVPGGSSGGSAAALRAELCAGALGSDTGGSIRQPASYTASVGVKPTYGRCSRWGLVAFASSLDQAGPIARDVTDAALIMNAISGYDPKDSTSANIPKEDFTKDLDLGVKGLKIGIPSEYQLEGMDPKINELWQNSAKLLKEAGAEIVDISLPHTEYGAPTYYIINTAEASSNLARYDGVKYGLRVGEAGDSLDQMYAKTRSQGFGSEVKKRIMVGTYVLSSGYYDAYYKKAQRVRRLISEDFDKAFVEVDAILTPTAPNSAFGIEENLTDMQMYHNDIFTVSANLAGIPAITLPAGVDKDNLPIGVQLMSPRFSENLLFRIAKSLEEKIAFDVNSLTYRI